MPFTLIEAMSVGLPIIGGDHASITEVLQNAGIIVSSNSHDAIKDAVIRILDDKNLRVELSKKSKKRSMLFSEKYMLDEYERLLQEGKCRS